MTKPTPEAEHAALQAELDRDLGVLAPRLGTPPRRFASNMLWAWIGAAILGPVWVAFSSGATWGATLAIMAAGASWGLCWWQRRAYWQAVRVARVTQRERAARGAAQA